MIDRASCFALAVFAAIASPAAAQEDSEFMQGVGAAFIPCNELLQNPGAEPLSTGNLCNNSEAALSELIAANPDVPDTERTAAWYGLAFIQLGLARITADYRTDDEDAAVTALAVSCVYFEKGWNSLGNVQPEYAPAENLNTLTNIALRNVEDCRSLFPTPDWGRPLPPG